MKYWLREENPHSLKWAWLLVPPPVHDEKCHRVQVVFRRLSTGCVIDKAFEPINEGVSLGKLGHLLNVRGESVRLLGKQKVRNGYGESNDFEKLCC